MRWGVSPQGASLVRVPIVMAAAMYGTLFLAPDPEDLDVPRQLAVRDWDQGRRVRRATLPDGGWCACRLRCLETLLQ
jgi:hypothetical protein